MPNFFSRLFQRSAKFVSFDDLRPSHFEQHKIWLDSHLHDFGNDKYENVSEEAFRPWDGDYPASREFTGLVATKFTIDSGESFRGYVTNYKSAPTKKAEPLLSHYPEIFVDSGTIAFWHGAVYQFGRKFMGNDMDKLEELAGLPLNQIFPIQYSTVDGALAQPISGEIEGFGFYTAENIISKITDKDGS